MTVYLVGAGPGDPGLLTVRGAELVRRADAVVHDRLVHAKLLDLVPRTAEVHDVGKRPGARADQDDINKLLIEVGGRFEDGTVVRLKGGDPYVFGRGGEEAVALMNAGLTFEVVPGVSAPNGVLAYAGIPLTYRGLSAGFTVVTGHGADGSVSGGPVPVDWDALARLGGTIVILMGVEHRAEISERLIAGGRSPETPVAVVENGTLPGQRTTRTTLVGLATADVGAPATVVVGDVAGLDLAWFGDRPLAGWRVAVTRTRDQASVLARVLSDEGAEPIEVPTIAITDPDDGGDALRRALRRLSEYSWVVFTSQNTVSRVFDELRDARAFGTTKVASIGDSTAGELAKRGVLADLVPGRFVSEALAEAFPAAATAGERVLLPRAAVARDVLPEALRAKGYEVEIVDAYKTIRPAVEPELRRSVRSADAVMFTSSSTVLGWLEVLGRDTVPPVVACIGPVTAATARDAGLSVDVEPAERSIRALVEALAAYARTRGRPQGSHRQSAQPKGSQPKGSE